MLRQLLLLALLQFGVGWGQTLVPGLTTTTIPFGTLTAQQITDLITQATAYQQTLTAAQQATASMLSSLQSMQSDPVALTTAVVNALGTQTTAVQSLLRMSIPGLIAVPATYNNVSPVAATTLTTTAVPSLTTVPSIPTIPGIPTIATIPGLLTTTTIPGVTPLGTLTSQQITDLITQTTSYQQTLLAEQTAVSSILSSLQLQQADPVSATSSVQTTLRSLNSTIRADLQMKIPGLPITI